MMTETKNTGTIRRFYKEAEAEENRTVLAAGFCAKGKLYVFSALPIPERKEGPAKKAG